MCTCPTLHALHARFLELLPRIELHGRIYFRHLNAHDKGEALQELRCLAWKRFCHLARRGKDVGQFMFNFNRFLVRHISAGRRVVGMQKAKDVLSPRAQRQHGFLVQPLPTSPRATHASLYSAVCGQREQDVFEERLQDNMVSPIPLKR